MNPRDNLLRYARYISDSRIGRCTGYCHSHMMHQSKDDPITPTPCSILAEMLPDLTDDTIQLLTTIAKGALTLSPEAQRGLSLLSKLRSEYANTVCVAAQALYDVQTAGASTGEGTAV